MSRYVPWEENNIHYIVSLDGTIFGQGNSLNEALKDAYLINGITPEEVAL